jgi:predicted nuclease with TOPRIM domain
MELNERVAKLEVEVHDHEKKLDNLEKLTAATSELAFSVKEMASDMSELKDSTKKLSDKMEDIENKPGKLSIKAWVFVATAVAGAAVGWLISLVGGAL